MGGFSEPPGFYRGAGQTDPTRWIAAIESIQRGDVQAQLADSLYQSRLQDVIAQSEKESRESIYRVAAESLGRKPEEVPLYMGYMPELEEVARTRAAIARPQQVETRAGWLAPIGIGPMKKSIHIPTLTPGLHEDLAREAALKGVPRIREAGMGQIAKSVEQFPELLPAGKVLGREAIVGPVIHPSDVQKRLQEITETGTKAQALQQARLKGPLELRKMAAEAGKAEVDYATSVATQNYQVMSARADSELKTLQAASAKLKSGYEKQQIELEIKLKQAEVNQKEHDYNSSLAIDKKMQEYVAARAAGRPPEELSQLLVDAYALGGIQGANGILTMDEKQQELIRKHLESIIRGRLSLGESFANKNLDPSVLQGMIDGQNRLEHFAAKSTGAATMRLWAAPKVSGFIGSTVTPGAVEVPTPVGENYVSGRFIYNIHQALNEGLPNIAADSVAWIILLQNPHLQSLPSTIDELVDKDYFAPGQEKFPGVDPALVKAHLKLKVKAPVKPPSSSRSITPLPRVPQPLSGVDPYGPQGVVRKGVEAGQAVGKGIVRGAQGAIAPVEEEQEQMYGLPWDQGSPSTSPKVR